MASGVAENVAIEWADARVTVVEECAQGRLNPSVPI